MTKRFQKFFALFLGCQALSAFALNLDFKVTEKLQGRAVALLALEVSLVKHSPGIGTGSDGRPSGSMASASLLIRGRYDTPCLITDLMLRVLPVDLPRGSPATSSVELIGVEDKRQGDLNLETAACGGGAQGQFEMPIDVTLNGWSSGTSEKVLVYTFAMDRGRRPSQTLELRFRIGEGWSYTLK